MSEGGLGADHPSQTGEQRRAVVAGMTALAMAELYERTLEDEVAHGSHHIDVAALDRALERLDGVARTVEAVRSGVVVPAGSSRAGIPQQSGRESARDTDPHSVELTAPTVRARAPRTPLPGAPMDERAGSARPDRWLLVGVLTAAYVALLGLGVALAVGLDAAAYRTAAGWLGALLSLLAAALGASVVYVLMTRRR